MTLMYYGKPVGHIITNHGMTVEEACICLGYDPADPDDCERAYEDGFPPAYCDDMGYYAIDTEELHMEY